MNLMVLVGSRRLHIGFPEGAKREANIDQNGRQRPEDVFPDGFVVFVYLAFTFNISRLVDGINRLINGTNRSIIGINR